MSANEGYESCNFIPFSFLFHPIDRTVITRVLAAIHLATSVTRELGGSRPPPFKPRRPEIGPNLAARLAIERCLPRAAARGHIAFVRTNVATRPLKNRTGLKLLMPPLPVVGRRMPGSARAVKMRTAPSKRLWRKHTPHFLL